MSQKATLTELLKTVFREQMKDVGTSIPGHVLSFDPSTQLAQLQIGIQKTSNTGERIIPSVLIECPVQFSGGNAFHVEHQLDPNDEGIIIFSQRCIDAWVDQGGIAGNPILRFHDINDAYFVPGLRSQPNKITGFDNNGIKIRNKAGDQFLWLKNDNTMMINIPTLFGNGDITHVGDTTHTGKVDIIGPVTSTVSFTAPNVVALTSLTVNGVEQKEHVHAAGTYKIGSSFVTGNSGVTP